MDLGSVTYRLGLLLASLALGAGADGYAQVRRAVPVSVAINESIPRITRELNRKFEEFGYKSSTNPDGKDYIVAMDANISNWIEGGYGDGQH